MSESALVTKYESVSNLPVNDDPIVELDVGGTYFKSHKSTLSRSPYFAALLSAKYSDFKPDQRIFLDRSPRLFEQVLRFLRDPSYKVSHNALGELQFFGIFQNSEEAPPKKVDPSIVPIPTENILVLGQETPSNDSLINHVRIGAQYIHVAGKLIPKFSGIALCLLSQSEREETQDCFILYQNTDLWKCAVSRMNEDQIHKLVSALFHPSNYRQVNVNACVYVYCEQKVAKKLFEDERWSITENAITIRRRFERYATLVIPDAPYLLERILRGFF